MNKHLPFLFVFGLLVFSNSSLIAQAQNALDFDNVDDYVVTPNASAGLIESPEMSMTCWVKPANPNPGWPDFDGLCGFRNEFDADFYILHLNATTVECRLRTSDFNVYTFEYSGVTLNEWQHFAMTYNGEGIVLYHNGVMAASLPAAGGFASPSESFFIGSLPFQNNPFHYQGQIDEVSLWNKTLTEDEIMCIYNNEINPDAPGLQLYYKMNQGEASGDNSGETSLIDATGTLDGQMNGFALNGDNSNFVAGIENSNHDYLTICEGETIIVNGEEISAPGTYTFVITDISGCEVIQTITLSVSTVDNTVTELDGTLTTSATDAVYQWIDCSDNSIIVDATDQSYTPSQSGSYAVLVTSAEGCDNTSDCVEVIVSNTQNTFFEQDLKIYPNPASSFLTIAYEGILKMDKVFIKTVAGKEIFAINNLNKNTESIDVQHLTEGVYFLEIHLENGSFYTKKWLKQK